MSNSSKASKRLAKAYGRSGPKTENRTSRLRDFIIWRKIADSPAPTITAPARDVLRKPAPSPAIGPPASRGGCRESKRKGQFYTRADLAKRYLRRLQNFVDLTDFQMVEPSAGGGAFMKVLPFGSFGCDIEPLCEDVFTADFLTLEINSNRPIVCIGNPPFGRNSKLAVRFFNRAASFSEVIAFILPRTFRKASIINMLDDRFHLLYEVLVPGNAFVFEGKPHSVPTVFQIWVRREDRRAKLPEIRDHDDFTFTTAAEADFALQRVGKDAGLVHHDMSRSRKAHYFIKGNVEGIMKKLRPAFAKVAANTAGNPSLAMTEIVAIYSKRISRGSRKK